jgi:hypothetical protein
MSLQQRTLEADKRQQRTWRPGRKPTKDYQKLLTALYAAHKPSKIKDVKRLLVEWAGREAELLEQVQRKYRNAQWRLLCYGDGLTVGSCELQKCYPYSAVMEQQMGGSLVCTAVGACGATAEKLLIQADTAGNFDVDSRQYNGVGVEIRQGKYDCAVIMAGSHDLILPPADAVAGEHALGFGIKTSLYSGGWARSSPEDIVASIKGLHERCHAEGVRTIALAVPSNASVTLYASNRATQEAEASGMDPYTFRYTCMFVTHARSSTACPTHICWPIDVLTVNIYVCVRCQR